MRRTLLVPLALALVATTVACSPKKEATTAAPSSCTTSKLPVRTKGVLTVATDSPAYDPWFSNDDPTNGKGFESAVAYALAGKLGFAKSQVHWVKEPFNNSYAPGPKKFDFDVNQISITPARAQVVDFSTGYYSAAQAVVTLKKSGIKPGSLADLTKLKLGAQTGTTSLTAIRDVIKPTQQPVVFTTDNVAKQALLNGQVDGIVVDLPTAFYITAAEINGSTIVGQFEQTQSPEQFGMLFAKGNPLVSCVDKALAGLKSDGTLAALQKQWLSDTVDVPVLK